MAPARDGCLFGTTVVCLNSTVCELHDGIQPSLLQPLRIAIRSGSRVWRRAPRPDRRRDIFDRSGAIGGLGIVDVTGLVIYASVVYLVLRGSLLS